MKLIDILLVEDNEGDIVLTTEALQQGKITNRISVVKNGIEAIEYLEKKGEYKNAKTPDLILLDINLPKMNGHEVLKKIKSIDHLRYLPVIILSTSSSLVDVKNSYINYANCYITKPVDANDFLKVVATIKDFWISIVQLPKKE